MIPVDTEVVALLAAGNRDPERFEDPERFDVGRYLDGRDAQPHLSFGGGVHLCLGAHLARLEAQSTIGGLVQRFENLSLVDAETEWGRSLFRVPAHVPIRFSVR